MQYDRTISPQNRRNMLTNKVSSPGNVYKSMKKRIIALDTGNHQLSNKDTVYSRPLASLYPSLAASATCTTTSRVKVSLIGRYPLV